MEGTQDATRPRSLAGTVALFAAVYVVWQPVFQLVLHAIFGDPIPFGTRAEWGWFIAVCAAVGAAAGVIWWMAAPLPRRSLLRAWARAGVTMLAMGVMLRAGEFSRDRLGEWLLLLTLTALLAGAVFAPFVRWSERKGETHPEPRSGVA